MSLKGYQRGDTLKFSEEGLDWLSGGDAGRKAKLATMRFGYRCSLRKAPECITVIKLGRGYYQRYHYSFLEPFEADLEEVESDKRRV